MTAYSSARDEFKDATADMIFIDANENPFDTGLNRYPDPAAIESESRNFEVTQSFH